MKHSAELRRCLVETDLTGLMAVWRDAAPHLAELPPFEALKAMHMARIEAKSIPSKLKRYSLRWLAEHDIELIDGKWVGGLPKAPSGVVEAVGIASLSMSGDMAFSRRIVTAMQDALLEGLERNIIDPPMQREAMLKARQAVKSKARAI